MFLNKKGDINVIKDIIFLLVVLAIFLVVFGLFYPNFLYAAGTTAACKNWVYIQSTPFLKEIKTTPSPCITTEETIKDNDKNKIYEQLAQNMYSCWDQYGKGEADFYSNIDFGKSDTHCRICSEIKIDQSIKNKEIDIDDFEIYLSSYRPPSHKETYAEFFTGAEHAKLDFGEGKISLAEGEQFYSIFLVNKRADWSAGGIINKFVLIPAAAFGLGSQIPGAGKLPKAVGGLINFKTGSASAFKGVPSYLGGATKTVKGGGGWGLLILYIATVGLATTADGSVLYPSLALLPSNSPQIEECSDIYYNPQSLLNKK